MPDLLSLSRMARRLGVTQQWLRDQADAGKIPCLKAGNRFLFNPDAVIEFLAAAASLPNPPTVKFIEPLVTETTNDRTRSARRN